MSKIMRKWEELWENKEISARVKKKMNENEKNDKWEYTNH